MTKDEKKLQGVHPRLMEIVLKRILPAMDAMGYPMFVVEGLRTAQRQAALYAQGRTKPGLIVTMKDGIIRKSNHQAKADGQGYAVDLAFVDNRLTPETAETWDAKMPWEVYGSIARYHGCVWGGDWKSLVDKPHIELSL